jgi:hypothetical protein
MSILFGYKVQAHELYYFKMDLNNEHLEIYENEDQGVVSFSY